MAKRKRIALIYAYNENWIGGTYYIENLIAALSKLPDEQKPELAIFSLEPTDAERLKQAVQYPYWSFRQLERTLSLPERMLNKGAHLLLNRRPISNLHADIDLVFPLPTAWRRFFSKTPHHLYWVPDFQEHYLPAFFQPEEIEARKADQQLILGVARHIVFSSQAAHHDFNTIYPNNTLTQHVLPFAVTSKGVGDAASCLTKYGITGPYFICSNQFWKHKNHLVVLQALAQVLDTHPETVVLFTGKEHDYRNPTYFDELAALRETLGLAENARFLGFIPREDQQTLMSAALAVIQPSLFEGWSTVIEDAKSLGVPILASDLPVHREQLACYEAMRLFDPAAPSALVEAMNQAITGGLPAKPYTYTEDVSRFAQQFMSIVKHVSAAS